MSTIDSGAGGRPRPSSRRCSVSFQDTCTVIPEVELRKPRLCTRTYSVCLSKKPPSDLLYDETFIPSHPTTLTFHLPSFTRAPPLPHRARSRRSSTGGTPGFFGYKGEDQCGLRSCLLKSAHKEYLQEIKEQTPPSTGPKATPSIVHRETPNALASPLEIAPHAKSSSGLLSPVLRHSPSQADRPSSPIRSPTSPSSSHGFGISKVSSLVTRPFLRRSRTSSSTVPRSESQDSVRAPLLSRSRSTSIGALSLRKGPLGETSHALTRSQSVNPSSASNPAGETKPNLVPLVCEKVRHPGCIDEEAVAEEEDDDIAHSPADMREDFQAMQRTPTQPPRHASLLPSPMSTDTPTVIPIHDCCDACTRNTLLGMREDYTPPFSPSAIRKIQREQEEKQERAKVDKDVAKVASVTPRGPRKVWNGRTWVEETVSTGEEGRMQARATSVTSGADEDSDDDPEQRASSIHGPTFGNDKARSMMVDEVEYVRRLRRASSTSTLEQAGEQPIPEAIASKKNCIFNGEKIRKPKAADSAREIPSPDHGIWYVEKIPRCPAILISIAFFRITSKPSPSRCSPPSPSLASTQHDYWNARPVVRSVDQVETPVAPPSHQDMVQLPARSSATDQAEEKEVRLALEKEAEVAKRMAKEVPNLHRSHSPSSKNPASTTEERKWFKIPLTSPLVVPGVG